MRYFRDIACTKFDLEADHGSGFEVVADAENVSESEAEASGYKLARANPGVRYRVTSAFGKTTLEFEVVQ